MLNILIYGSAEDEAILLNMLDTSPSVYFRKKKYIYVSDYDDYIQALKNNELDLVIVTENSKQGCNAVREALKISPQAARFWFSDEKGYVTESYDLQCTWFAPKPLTQEILDKALTRFNHVTLTQNDLYNSETITSGGSMI